MNDDSSQEPSARAAANAPPPQRPSASEGPARTATKACSGADEQQRRLTENLRGVFGLDDFRPLQREAVDAVLRVQASSKTTLSYSFPLGTCSLSRSASPMRLV